MFPAVLGEALDEGDEVRNTSPELRSREIIRHLATRREGGQGGVAGKGADMPKDLRDRKCAVPGS